MDRRTFWEGKICEWEAQRYDPKPSFHGVLEWIANRLSGPVRYRKQYAESLLSRRVAGMRVVELGCGGGRLAPAIIAAGAADYFGLDIADPALESARWRVAGAGIGERTRFAQVDVAALPPLDADIVVSLGLFDWLSPEEIDTVFARSGRAHFLHSVSERRHLPSQWAHRTYVWGAYARKPDTFAPRYVDVRDVLAAAARHSTRPVSVHRDHRLSFCAILTTLA